MSYSTEKQVRAVLVGRRTEDRNETANELDVDQIEYAIKSADAQIDLVLRRRYVLPLQVPIPDIINTLSIDIATYLCMLTFRGTTVVSGDDPAAIRYDRARRMLSDIQRGQVDLGMLEVATESDLESVYNLLPDPLFPTHPWFGEEYAEGQIPPDRIYHRSF